MKENIPEILLKKKLTVSVAESCTGGLLCCELTDVPGSSKYFMLGLVPYANEAKTHLLDIPPKLIQRHGAVSQKTAIEMAKNVRRLGKTDIGLSITGIAGPDGGQPLKPVGTVFIAVALKQKIYYKKFIFSGNRLTIKKSAKDAALNLLKQCLR